MAFIEYWHSWLIIGFLILAVELLTGTYFLLAIAGGALLTAAFTWWLLPSITVQLFTLALASIASYLFLRAIPQKFPLENSDGTTHMLGQQVEVVEAVHHTGRVIYKGVLWQAVASDVIPVKRYAKITAIHGNTLTIIPIIR